MVSSFVLRSGILFLYLRVVTSYWTLELCLNDSPQQADMLLLLCVRVGDWEVRLLEQADRTLAVVQQPVATWNQVEIHKRVL